MTFSLSVKSMKYLAGAYVPVLSTSESLKGLITLPSPLIVPSVATLTDLPRIFLILSSISFSTRKPSTLCVVPSSKVTVNIPFSLSYSRVNFSSGIMVLSCSPLSLVKINSFVSLLKSTFLMSIPLRK